jgi:hypothetical protein
MSTSWQWKAPGKVQGREEEEKQEKIHHSNPKQNNEHFRRDNKAILSASLAIN